MSEFSRAMAMAMALAAGGVALAAPSHAEGFNFGCDVPADRFSPVVQSVKGTDFRLSGTMKGTILRSGKFMAMAEGGVVSPDKSAYVYARLIRALDEEKMLYVTLVSMIDGQERDQPLAKVKLGTPVSFDFSVESSGKLFVRYAGHEEVFPMTFTDGVDLSVLCSTGEFEFTDVRMEEHARE